MGGRLRENGEGRGSMSSTKSEDGTRGDRSDSSGEVDALKERVRQLEDAVVRLQELVVPTTPFYYPVVVPTDPPPSRITEEIEITWGRNSGEYQGANKK